MATTWKAYQQETAAFFRNLGLDADTDVVVEGVRTSHNVDVLVRSHHVGFDVTWVVECKHWRRRISKVHVFALRAIVTDLGADRGILLSERGFQSGALEAAALTNVHLASLADVRQTASADVVAMRLRELYDRVDASQRRYSNIPKQVRIDYDLRPDLGEAGYSVGRAIGRAAALLDKAFRGNFPISSERAFEYPGLPEQLLSRADVLAAVEPIVTEFEARLAAYDRQASGTAD